MWISRFLIYLAIFVAMNYYYLTKQIITIALSACFYYKFYYDLILMSHYSFSLLFFSELKIPNQNNQFGMCKARTYTHILWTKQKAKEKKKRKRIKDVKKVSILPLEKWHFIMTLLLNFVKNRKLMKLLKAFQNWWFSRLWEWNGTQMIRCGKMGIYWQWYEMILM